LYKWLFGDGLMLILGRGCAVGLLEGWRMTLGSSSGRWWSWLADEVVVDGEEELHDSACTAGEGSFS